MDILDRPHEVVDVFRVDLDVEHVDVREALEQHSFAFHDGFSRQSTDVAKPEDRRPIGYDSDQVSSRGVLEGVVRILGDLGAWHRDARAVGQRQVPRGPHGLAWNDLQFSGASTPVILKGFFVLPAVTHRVCLLIAELTGLENELPSPHEGLFQVRGSSGTR